MSVIRQQAIELIERMPEAKIHYLINILKNIEELMASPNAEEEFDSQTAYQELEKYRKKGIADRNYKDELYAALEEKYANTN